MHHHATATIKVIALSIFVVYVFGFNNANRSYQISLQVNVNIPRSKSKGLVAVLHAVTDEATATTENTNGAEPKLRPGSLLEATKRQGRVPYGEESRKYRRTVYNYDDWVVHRSNDRLVETLRGIFFSGIVRQLQQEVGLVTAVATLVVLWNDFLVPSSLEIFDGSFMLPCLSLPSLPFALSTSALALLLVFRTNASYSRWLESRKMWSKITSQSRNAIRMAATFVDPEEAGGRQSLERLSSMIWLFCRSLMNKLSAPDDESEFEEEVLAAFPDDPDFVSRILNAPNRPLAALMEASLTLDEIPVDEKRRVETDKSLVIAGDQLSECERISTTPVPLVYTRHTARFLSLWMILLPIGLYETFAAVGGGNAAESASIFQQYQGLALIPASALISLFLFGIEELSMQLEEPFTILPMNVFCDDVKQSLEGLIDWRYQSAASRSKALADE